MSQYKDSFGTMHTIPDDLSPDELDQVSKSIEQQAHMESHLAQSNAGLFDRSAGDQAVDAVKAAGHHAANAIIGLGQGAEHSIAWVGDKLLPAPQQTTADVVAGRPGQPQGVLQGVRAAMDSRLASDDRAITAREQAYQKDVPNSAGAYIGATVGEVAPWMTGVAELRALGVLPKVGGTLKKLALLAGEGGAMGAAQPVTDNTKPYAAQKATQIATGAVAAPVLAAGTAVAGKVAAPLRYLLDSGREGLANERLGEALHRLGVDPAQLSGYQSRVPGYQPFVAEAAPSPGVVMAQRAMQNGPAGLPLKAAEDANNVALRNEAASIAGSDADMQSAIDARKAATQPFIDQHLTSQTIADRFGNALKALNDFATANPNPGKDTAAAINGARKTIRDVISGKTQEDEAVAALQEHAASVPEKVGGGASKAMAAFDAAHAAINKNMIPVQSVVDAIHRQINTGIGTNPIVAGGLRDLLSDLSSRANTRGMVSADILDGIRQNASRYLAKHAPHGAVGTQEAAGVAPIQSAITDLLDKAMPADPAIAGSGYRGYLGAYAQHSQPITDMEAGRSLLGRIDSGGRDTSGNQAVNLNPVKQLLTKDDAARYGMSPAVRERVENILDALQQRTVPAGSTGAKGSQTAVNLLTQPSKDGKNLASLAGGTLATLLANHLGVPAGAMDVPVSVGAFSGIKKLLEDADQKVMTRMGEKAANAPDAAKAMDIYRRKAVRGGTLQSLLRPYDKALPAP